MANSAPLPDSLGPELSSMAATLEELTFRVTAMAERSVKAPDHDVAARTRRAVNLSQELFEIERTLAEAQRRLVALSRAIR